MLNRFYQCLAILAVVALSALLFARSMSMSQPLNLTKPATIGSTTLEPGQYQLTANLTSDQVLVKHNGKLVATVTGKTVTLNNKSPYGAVVFDGSKIHEIDFSGKTQAIRIPNS